MKNKVNTVSDLINLAYDRAREGHLASTEIKGTPDEALYYERLEMMLEIHNWLFSFDLLKSSRISEVEPPLSLGYNRAYALPSDIIEVLSIRPQRTDLSHLSPRQQLRAGYAPDFHDYIDYQEPEFTFVEGILYTDYEVTEVLAKKTPSPTEMTASFREALKTDLAEIFCSKGNNDPNLKSAIRSEHKQAIRRAIGLNTKQIKINRNPVVQVVRWYLRTIHSSPSYRGI